MPFQEQQSTSQPTMNQRFITLYKMTLSCLMMSQTWCLFSINICNLKQMSRFCFPMHSCTRKPYGVNYTRIYIRAIHDVSQTCLILPFYNMMLIKTEPGWRRWRCLRAENRISPPSATFLTRAGRLDLPVLHQQVTNENDSWIRVLAHFLF